MLELFLLNVQLNSNLTERAWQEPQFERQLQEQPRQTLERALNVKLPDGVAYQLLKDQALLYHLILPYVPAQAGAEEKAAIYRQTAQQYDPAWRVQLTALFAKAEDARFRQALLAQPNTVLAEFLGLAIPPEVSIHVFENSASQRYLVLPFNNLSETPEAELSGMDLALLAGGLSSIAMDTVGPGDPPVPSRRRC